MSETEAQRRRRESGFPRTITGNVYVLSNPGTDPVVARNTLLTFSLKVENGHLVRTKLVPDFLAVLGEYGAEAKLVEENVTIHVTDNKVTK